MNAPVPQPTLQVVKGIAAEYFAEDSSDSDFFIGGKVTGGELTFTIVARVPSANKRSLIPASDYFDAMMNHFVGQATKITSVRAEWNAGDPDMASNLNAFNQYTAAGDSEVVAAGKTFTGRMARKWQYTVVKWIQALPIGNTGRYSDVVVQFTK